MGVEALDTGSIQVDRVASTKFEGQKWSSGRELDLLLQQQGFDPSRRARSAHGPKIKIPTVTEIALRTGKAH